MTQTTITNQKFIILEDITVRLFDRFVLSHTSWEINRGENWAVVGPNGSGKSTLVRALAGEVPVVHGRIVSYSDRPLKELIGYVSFELQRDLIREEADRDDARYFSDNFSDLKTARQIIISGTDGETSRFSHLEQIVDNFDLNHLLDHPIRFLSAGEMRKVVIARALLKEPELLILDEPYDGLDVPSRRHVAEIIDKLMSDGVQIIFVAHRIEDIPSGISHVLCTENLAIVAKGQRHEIINGEMIGPVFETSQTSLCDLCHEVAGKEKCVDERPEILIEMNDVTVSYGNMAVIKDLWWTMHRGEHWTIVGPNGSGKSTLVRTLVGEVPVVRGRIVSYSTRPLKELIGYVSFELQRDLIREEADRDDVRYFSDNFNDLTTARQIIISGTNGETSRLSYLKQIVRDFDLNHLLDCPIRFLSAGEMRKVVIARALLKEPELLILDEPYDGLDVPSRRHLAEIAVFKSFLWPIESKISLPGYLMSYVRGIQQSLRKDDDMNL